MVLTVQNVNRLSDKAPNLPASSATVTVAVVNENEAPLFRDDPIQIVVPESVLPGTLLRRNIAFDPEHLDLRYEAATKKRVKKNGQFNVSVTVTLLSAAGMSLAEIPRGGWRSTETRETLLPREGLTCDPQMSETISTMLLSRLQVSLFMLTTLVSAR